MVLFFDRNALREINMDIQEENGGNVKERSSAKKMLLNKWVIRSAVFIAALLLCAYLLPKLLYALYHESTDDAFIEGTIVPVSAEVIGRVVKVYIDDNDQVNAGDPLLEIYREDYVNIMREKEENLYIVTAEQKEIEKSLDEKERSLARAHADLGAARADESLATAELTRYSGLIKDSLVSESDYDHVKSRLEVAKARVSAARAAVAEAEAAINTLQARRHTYEYIVKQAEATLSLAKIDLSRTLVVAPITGRVAKKNVDEGKYIQAGQPVLALVDERDTWIVANFKETQIERMRIGQPVSIEVDAYPGVSFQGHVESFQPGTGATFSLLPPENATGNFVKVVQRVPVKIVFDSPYSPDYPLWPGLSVIPHVDVSITKGTKLKGAALEK